MERRNKIKELNQIECLQQQYRDYFDLIAGHLEINRSPIRHLFHSGNKNALFIYQSVYLKNQILHWGGAIEDIFCSTCKLLENGNIKLEAFVSFFYSYPLSLDSEFDYFKIKLDRFREFVIKISKTLDPPLGDKLLRMVDLEYQASWSGYRLFNPPD